jgi:hypothetical protein
MLTGRLQVTVSAIKRGTRNADIVKSSNAIL